jgi:hypothetical protein
MDEMNMGNLVKVTKEEFDDFIKSYPDNYERSCIGICEPPVLNYYELSFGKACIEALFAQIILKTAMGEKEDDYYIKGNPDETT